MKITYIIVFISYLLASSLQLTSSLQAQELLTLDDCLNMALEHNNQTKIAGKNREIAKLDLKIYQSQYLPKLSLSGNYLYSNTSLEKTIQGGLLPTLSPDASGNMVPNGGAAYFPDIPLELKVNSIFNTSLMLSQPIYTGGKITSANKMALIGNQMADLAEELTTEEVILICEQTYWNVIKSSSMVETASKYLETLQELERNVENAVNEGLAHNKDLLTVNVKVNEAILNMARVQNAYKLSVMNLNHIIGLPLDTNTSIQKDYEVFSHEELSQISIESRPEYQLLENQVKLNLQNEKIAKSELLPTIGLAGAYSYTNGLELNREKLMNGGNFAALVSLKVPLTHWGEFRNNLKKAQIKTDISRIKKEEIAEQMYLEATMQYNKVKESLLEVKLTKTMVERAQENMDVCKDRYEAGMETLASYLEAQATLYKCRSEYISSQTNLNLNITTYKKAAGHTGPIPRIN